MSEIATNIERGRADLLAWETARPRDWLGSDPNIENVLKMHFGDRYGQHREAIAGLARAAADPEVDAAVRASNRDENLPRLERYDGRGVRTEEIVFHPSYHQVGALFWRSGVLSVLGSPGGELLSGALAYFLDQHGEAGHACPVACTAGLIKLVLQVGTRDQQQRFLPLLLERDYAHRIHGAQYVTEVQGGSDVGLNGCVAVPDGKLPGIYRISGEKWFCSVIDASLFVVSARVEGGSSGTGGLGLFLVPRRLADQPNSFTVRRLKYKLGTRSMASAEVDFDGAYAEPIGALERGFKNLVGIVLDTSRVHNALAACGMMRRAYMEAWTFAQHRRAFGQRIIEHPMVQETLARMRLHTSAAVASTFRILAMSDRVGTQAQPPGELVRARRVQVTVNKYWTSVMATATVRDGIEVLGGNGTIEEFSVLPRLYRDAIVIESWEGTHNTLCAQVLRDFATRGLHRAFCAELRGTIAGIDAPALLEQQEYASGLLADLEERIGRLLAADRRRASGMVRHVVDRMAQVNSYVSLLAEHAWERGQGAESDKEELLRLYQLLVLDRVDPMAEPQLQDLAERLSGRL